MASLKQVRNRLRKFKENRILLNDLKDTIIPGMQKELIVQMLEADPDNKGIVIVIDGEEEAAFVQANQPTSFWNQEQIVAFLKKDPKLWAACSSRVFDPKKWEAEVSNGNIPKATADQFKEHGEPPSPFIRFGKPKKDSLK